jgi:hypothetical protein
MDPTDNFDVETLGLFQLKDYKQEYDKNLQN